jgi:Ca-activated chloride channel family protein
MLEFAWPLAILALPLPWLISKLLPAVKQQQAAMWVPFFEELSQIQVNSVSHPGSQRKALRYAAILIWIALIAALMRPYWVGDAIELPTTGRDLMVAVDISDSMQLEDMTLNTRKIDRLSLVKHVVNDFVQRREGDRLGLLLFGSQAYIQAPLTFDRATVGRLLNETEIGFAGKRTAIGDAIGLAIKRLQHRPASSRVVILLTDGENTAGEVEPLKAAELAAQENVRIYTIGIGAESMLTEGILGFGRRTVNPSANLDEKTLTSIASQTGGRYFRARNEKELISIYQELDALEPVDQEAESFRPTRSLFHWPMGFAFALSLCLPFLITPHSLLSKLKRHDNDRPVP